MASFDKDGISPALQVAVRSFWSRFNCLFKAKSVLDAFEELNESEETKKILQRLPQQPQPPQQPQKPQKPQQPQP